MKENTCPCGAKYDPNALNQIYCSKRCRKRFVMRRYRGSKKYGGKECIDTYGCGCKKEEGVYLCEKHQRH